MERARVIPLDSPAPVRIARIGHGERSSPLVYDPHQGTLALPPGLIRELGLLPGQDIHVMARDGGHRFVIGPLVGLWVSPGAIREWSPSVRVLVEETRAAGAIPLVFDLDGAERGDGRIAGWVERDGRPGRVLLPLPDVIYNRATYPNLRRRARARRLRERMMELDRIPFVNTASGFPKWETYETLRFFAETRDLVPDAVRFGSLDSFARFLRRHRLAFLKENRGSMGAHVLRIAAVGGGWRVEGQSGPHRVRRRFSDVDELHGFLARLTRQGEWVLQEGVRLPRLRGRPWDVRLEAKKDENGEWQVPFVFVRWGHPAAVVTNEAQGGDIFLLADFRARFGRLKDVANLETTATRVGRLVALALEARFGMQGEIGVDFGLDPQGRPRVFEANAKSTHTPVPGQTVPQARWPLRYAVWLARRAWIGQESGFPLPVPAGVTLPAGTAGDP